MACSAKSLAGLLHPAADPGVRRVSGHVPGSLTGSWRRPSSSARAPFEAFSSSSAASLGPSRGDPALLPLTPFASIRRSSPSFHLPPVLRSAGASWRLARSSSGFRVLSRYSSSLRRPCVSAWARSMLPWVSVSVRDLVPQGPGAARLPLPTAARHDRRANHGFSKVWNLLG